MASDLIRREALFDAMREKEWQNWPPLDEIDDVIENAPAVDAVEVVRCKDCASCEPIPNTYSSLWCDEWDNCADCDGYCHKGVKKNGK